MAGPLAGVRVLDASGFISGPFAGTILADLGAEVIKVEPPAGDAMNRWGRNVGGRGLVYANVNRGKVVISLDLREDGDRARFVELAAGADVLVTNWRAAVVERLGLASPLSGLPSLIWLRITGWGPDGPLSTTPAFDGSVQARTGLAWAQGDDEPELLRTFVADKVTAMFATQAVVAALFERTTTGAGAVIDLPMLDALSYFNFPDVLQNRTAVADPPASARNEQIAANSPVRTADGWVVVSPVGGKQLKAALSAVGRPEAIEELKATTSQFDLTRRLVAILNDACPKRSTAEWLVVFDQFDVPVAPVLDIDTHLADPQVAHNRIYDEIDDPVIGQIRRVRYPVRFGDDQVRGARQPAQVVDAATVGWSVSDR